MLEVTVAIGIIIAGVLSTTTLIINSIKAGRVSADRLVAMNLAREGVEIVRNMRDGNWLTGDAWDDGYNDGGGYSATIVAPIIPLNVDEPLDFNYNPDGADAFGDEASGFRWSQVYAHSDGRYLQADWPNRAILGTPTHFSRLIFLNPICWEDPSNPQASPVSISTSRSNTTNNDCPASHPNEVGMLIRSEVRWPEYAGNYYNVVLEERIYDWK